jgi:hypothetical protein
LKCIITGADLITTVSYGFGLGTSLVVTGVSFETTGATSSFLICIAASVGRSVIVSTFLSLMGSAVTSCGLDFGATSYSFTTSGALVASATASFTSLGGTMSAINIYLN